MASSEEAVALLRSIDSSLKHLVKLLAASTKTKVTADDRDLDGQYGNPIVKFNPRDWTGPSFKGVPMSGCDADFLEMLADTFDYFGDKAEENDERANNGKPVAPYKRRDAARARGWAKRIREGRVPASTVETSGDWGRREEDDFA